jgi:hypothetical protein
MRSTIRLLDAFGAGQGSKIFLFKTFPAFASPEQQPTASGYLLTEPWQRAGFPPLYFDH